MKHVLMMSAFALASLAQAAPEETSAKHEIGLTLGGLLSGSRTGPVNKVNLGPGVALQANYGYRLFANDKVAVYGEVHLLANPLRDVSSSFQSATRDVATLFVTPGIRVKFFPGRNIAPFVVVGGGWANYQQSTTTLDGSANPAPRNLNHGVFDYGGGVDFKFWRFVGLRAEIRDFYAGAPAYNAPSIRGGQHNVVAGGGLVLKFK